MRNMIVASLTLGLGAFLTGCDADGAAEPDATRATASSSPSDEPSDLPIEAFADISDDPVSEEVAAEFQAALSKMSDLADGSGMSATVLSPDGVWTGTVGKADGDRDLRVDDQFAIASGTKPVVAAQVMQLVEAGQLDLDDPAADHLPPDLEFDTNGASIRNLLSHRSGIPDYDPIFQARAETDRTRRWTAEELLALVPAERTPVDRAWEYSSTNYVLLEQVIEHMTGRSLVAVLRDGVLNIEGVERLVYQSDEVPTEPMAMPFGGTTAALEQGGGFLPSLAHASGGHGAFGMASDSPSLANWWRALCSGEIVSQDSLTEMTPKQDEYGLGLFPFPDVGASALGHPGVDEGYLSWSACLPDEGAVIVVLVNGDANELFGLARPLVAAAA
jgi:D-alanyl-D-alanine carboxypeptidase